MGPHGHAQPCCHGKKSNKLTVGSVNIANTDQCPSAGSTLPFVLTLESVGKCRLQLIGGSARLCRVRVLSCFSGCRSNGNKRERKPYNHPFHSDHWISLIEVSTQLPNQVPIESTEHQPTTTLNKGTPTDGKNTVQPAHPPNAYISKAATLWFSAKPRYRAKRDHVQQLRLRLWQHRRLPVGHRPAERCKNPGIAGLFCCRRREDQGEPSYRARKRNTCPL